MTTHYTLQSIAPGVQVGLPDGDPLAALRLRVVDLEDLVLAQGETLTGLAELALSLRGQMASALSVVRGLSRVMESIVTCQSEMIDPSSSSPAPPPFKLPRSMRPRRPSCGLRIVEV